MRITSGFLGGRHLKVSDAIRPTQDKVRQAVFSSLADFVPGKRVLDLFAGSGALGLEAWSRGAASVTWVEKDPRVFEILRQNVESLAGTDPVLCCVRSDVDRYLQIGGAVFDLVLADPPYERAASESLVEKTLRGLLAKSMVRPGGVLVFEQDAGTAAAEHPEWSLLRDRLYGKTRVLIYQRAYAENGNLSRDV